MYNNTSRMANSILQYYQMVPEEVSTEQIYNMWTRTDNNNYEMVGRDRAVAAYKIIKSLQKVSKDDMQELVKQ